MIGLLVIGFLAGMIAGISPCILPVLPVVLVAGGTARVEGKRDANAARRRALAVTGGLVLSFGLITLAGTEALSALGLPQDLLRDVGIAVLALVGVGLLVPTIGEAIERPFLAVRGRPPRGTASGFVLGLGLGAVFIPCGGPVLAAITTIGANHEVGLFSVLLSLVFAAGAAVPLLAIALAGDGLVSRVGSLRRRAPMLRQAGGAVLIVMSVVLALNVTDGLQRLVPGYTGILQRHLEQSAYATKQLQHLTDSGSLGGCKAGSAALARCGAAPKFTDVTSWLHTPGGRPLNWAALRGEVVLVDFWTYSCINCQRSLPHVEAWYQRYRADGLVVVGVHTPEFAFEHVVSNVAAASRQLGVAYPVAVDNGYGTWDAFHNDYWPAEYLVDANGQLRHVDYGEGDYATSESLIRSLLVAAHPGLVLPQPTEVANRTPLEPRNPETYLGYQQFQYFEGATPVEDAPTQYHFPATLAPGYYGLSGKWAIHSEESTAVLGAKLELGFQARRIYLVLGGKGSLQVLVDGKPTKTLAVRIPRLYTLFSAGSVRDGTLLLEASPGIQAYDFTFG